MEEWWWWWETKTHLARLTLALVHDTTLDKPQPVAKGTVEQEVGDDGRQGVGLGGGPAKLPVIVEEGAGNSDGRIAEAQADVGLGVQLSEAQRVEVVGQRVVGRVLEV